jgi:hypothetical protein
MAFLRFPFLLMVMFLLMTGGRILPFLFIAFGLLFVLGAVRRGYRYEPRPTVSSDDLANLRTDVAVGLLEVDDDLGLKTNPNARSRFEAAGTYYTKASKALDRGVRRRDRDAVARTLYRARYELEATSAALDGRTLPEEPESPSGQRVLVATRQQRRPSRQRHHSHCGW